MQSKIKNPKVDVFLAKAKKWKEEMSELREIVVGCGLTEELKWYQPCYTYDGKIVAIISGFKDYCLIGFFKGSLLQDSMGLLSKPGENTQGVRQMRFTGIQEIVRTKQAIKDYVKEAIEIEKSGRKVEYKKTEDYGMPVELEEKFGQMPELKEAFAKLTPGRQRAYLLYFSMAKQSKTRTERINKYIPQILSGKGLND